MLVAILLCISFHLSFGTCKIFCERWLWYECTFRLSLLRCSRDAKKILRYTVSIIQHSNVQACKLTNYINGTTFDAPYWGKWPLKQKVNIIKFVLLKLNYISYLIFDVNIFSCAGILKCTFHALHSTPSRAQGEKQTSKLTSIHKYTSQYRDEQSFTGWTNIFPLAHRHLSDTNAAEDSNLLRKIYTV